MNKDEIKAQILSVVTELDQKDGATFADFMGIQGAKGGDNALEMQPNVIAWKFMAQEFVEALAELAREGKIIESRCNPQRYSHADCMIDLPILTIMQDASKLEEPHWIPIAFNLITVKIINNNLTI